MLDRVTRFDADGFDTNHALDHGCLWIKMNNGRYWRLRRNGRTQTWKRNVSRFRIPVKMGMYGYSEITNETAIGEYDSGANVIFALDDDIANIQKR